MTRLLQWLWESISKPRGRGGTVVDSSATEVIVCEQCKQRLRVPRAIGLIAIKCPRCGSGWRHDTGNRVIYQVIDVQQGTSPWHTWREGGLGASDAPAIMGENPWKTRGRLMSEKLSGARPFSNAAMARGAALEPEARRCYERTERVAVLPLCVESNERPWMRASLDGLSTDRRRVVEIKCGRSVYKYTYKNNQPPVYYVGQLQHILAVTGLSEIDFWCYLPNERPLHVRVARDQRYIDKLLVQEELFWKELERKRRS